MIKRLAVVALAGSLLGVVPALAAGAATRDGAMLRPAHQPLVTTALLRPAHQGVLLMRPAHEGV